MILIPYQNSSNPQVLSPSPPLPIGLAPLKHNRQYRGAAAYMRVHLNSTCK